MFLFDQFGGNKMVGNSVKMTRVRVLLLALMIVYLIMVMRIFDLAIVGDDSLTLLAKQDRQVQCLRGDIIDRNGEILATGLSVSSAYANPRKIRNVAETAERLHRIFPDMPIDNLRKQLTSDKYFVWIRRQMPPVEYAALLQEGIPGIYFIEEQKRIYPYKNLFAHSVGYVDIEGNGLAGIERYFDNYLKSENKDQLQLSLDVRLQYLMNDILADAVRERDAVGGAGILMNVKNCEILAIVSVPDFDANDMSRVRDGELFNRATLGVYELGSVLKSFAFAAAIDTGAVTLDDQFDITSPFKIADRVINDYTPSTGKRTVSDIFIYSSNVGTAKIAIFSGDEVQRSYSKNFGFFDYASIELYEKSLPIVNRKGRWNDLLLTTISYGYGIAATPMHLVNASAALVNDGCKCNGTLLLQDRSRYLQDKCQKILSDETVGNMKYLLRAVVTKGTGKRARTAGYSVGGKTGTANKLGDNGYDKVTGVASFVGFFPMSDPEYVFLLLLDEPRAGAASGRGVTGGAIVAPLAVRFVSESSAIIGIEPDM